MSRPSRLGNEVSGLRHSYRVLPSFPGMVPLPTWSFRPRCRVTYLFRWGDPYPWWWETRTDKDGPGDTVVVFVRPSLRGCVVGHGSPPLTPSRSNVHWSRTSAEVLGTDDFNQGGVGVSDPPLGTGLRPGSRREPWSSVTGRSLSCLESHVHKGSIFRG